MFSHLLAPMMFIFIAFFFLRILKNAEAHQKAAKGAVAQSPSQQGSAEANKVVQQALQAAVLPELPALPGEEAKQGQSSITTSEGTAKPAATVLASPVTAGKLKSFEPTVTEYDENELRIPAYFRHNKDVAAKVREFNQLTSNATRRKLAVHKAEQRRERRRKNREGIEAAATGLDFMPA